MAKTKTRLSWLLLALCVALALIPYVALGEEDDWYGYDEELSWYDDSWYEDDSSYVDEYVWYDDEDYAAYIDDDSWYEDLWYVDEYDSYDDGDWYEDDSWYSDEYDEEDSWYDDEYYEEDSYDTNTYSGYVGIDVSEWNGTIDWERVSASGIGYAILKCGGSDDWGGCYTDSEFVNNALECQRLGIPYGVYFYSTASTAREAEMEALHACSTIAGAGLSPSLPVFIDLECTWLADPSCADILAEVSYAFCTTVQAYGYQPGVYASASWWDYLLTDPCFDMWFKWAAQYSDSCQADCQWWQYSRWGEVDGIDWPVDLNYWM